MHPNLSFEQAPPLAVPLRFFLTAPWFGVAAGLLLVIAGDDAFASRFSPSILAVTHLMTTGFMLQAMCGALLQFVPVATGANVIHLEWLTKFIQPMLTFASLLLAAGFLRMQPMLFTVASVLFLLAGLGFVAIVSLALWQTPGSGMTLLALRSAVIALGVTLLLGAALAMTLAFGVEVPLLAMIEVHLTWGLAGWALLLLAAVSWIVVPMFQLTPAYPPAFTRAFLWALLGALALLSIASLLDAPNLATVGRLALLLIVASHAVLTLWLQQRRRRKLHDVTLNFFRLAMTSLLAFALLGAAALGFPALADLPRYAIGLGVLALIGVFAAAICGMLYKIVPFLGWLHLQRLGAPLSAVPNMKGMLAEIAKQRQLALHGLALLLLLVAVVWPGWLRAAGLTLALSMAALGINLFTAARRYAQFRDRIRATVPGRG